jgi:hypothetical protein
MAAGSAKSNIRPRRPNKHTYTSDSSRSSRSTAPSAGLLTLLASIAGFQPADASPVLPEQHIPPSFLCPFVDQEDIDVAFADTARVHINIAERGPPHSRRASNIINSNVKRHNVPDKYEQGADGRWRKASKYTLYGSTVCRVRSSIFGPENQFLSRNNRKVVILPALRLQSLMRRFQLHPMGRRFLQHQLQTSSMSYPAVGSLRIKQQEVVLLLS